MAELTPQERLQPALLDRLADDDPARSTEPLVDSVQYSVLRSGPPKARLVSEAPVSARSTCTGSARWLSTHT